MTEEDLLKMKQALGEKLVTLREKRHLTLKDLHEKTKISLGELKRIEQGDGSVGAYVLFKLLTFYGQV